MVRRRKTMITIRIDRKLAEKAERALGAKNRTEAVRRALEELLHTDHFKRWMLKYGGKAKFEGYVD